MNHPTSKDIQEFERDVLHGKSIPLRRMLNYEAWNNSTKITQLLTEKYIQKHMHELTNDFLQQFPNKTLFEICLILEKNEYIKIPPLLEYMENSKQTETCRALIQNVLRYHIFHHE